MLAELSKRAAALGIDAFRPIPPSRLNPDSRIREYCRDNRCGRYDRHYMCPPTVGTIESCRARLHAYAHGFLVQAVYPAKDPSDSEAVRRSKLDFHKKILELEAVPTERGLPSLGLVGGDCALCTPCFAFRNTPCPHPEKARPSLEALGVNVIETLAMLGLDTGFHPDRITWTGCVLY